MASQTMRLFRVVCKGRDKRGGPCSRYLGYHRADLQGNISGHYCRDCHGLTETETTSPGHVVRRLLKSEVEYDPAITEAVEEGKS